MDKAKVPQAGDQVDAALARVLETLPPLVTSEFEKAVNRAAGRLRQNAPVYFVDRVLAFAVGNTAQLLYEIPVDAWLHRIYIMTSFSVELGVQQFPPDMPWPVTPPARPNANTLYLGTHAATNQERSRDYGSIGVQLVKGTNITCYASGAASSVYVSMQFSGMKPGLYCK